MPVIIEKKEISVYLLHINKEVFLRTDWHFHRREERRGKWRWANVCQWHRIDGPAIMSINLRTGRQETVCCLYDHIVSQHKLQPHRLR